MFVLVCVFFVYRLTLFFSKCGTSSGDTEDAVLMENKWLPYVAVGPQWYVHNFSISSHTAPPPPPKKNGCSLQCSIIHRKVKLFIRLCSAVKCWVIFIFKSRTTL